MKKRAALIALCLAPSTGALAHSLPLRPGSYQGAGIACQAGMSVWANRMGEGLAIGDPSSPRYGDNCAIKKAIRKGDRFDLVATCAQGHDPERTRHIQIIVTGPASFTYRGKSLSWCAN